MALEGGGSSGVVGVHVAKGPGKSRKWVRMYDNGWDPGSVSSHKATSWRGKSASEFGNHGYLT